MVRDRELAEDLAQDTFVKILNHIDRYRPEFKLSSWLFKIANKRGDRSSPEAPGSTIQAWTDHRTPALPTRSSPPASRSPISRKRARRNGVARARVGDRKAIASLRPEYRACIMLRHVEDRFVRGNRRHARPALGTVSYIHRARRSSRLSVSRAWRRFPRTTVLDVAEHDAGTNIRGRSEAMAFSIADPSSRDSISASAVSC